MAKAKSCSVNKAPTNNAAVNNNETNLIFYLLIPLLLLAPFFRGLFFYDELVIAHMYTAIVAGLYFYMCRDKIRFAKSFMDYAGLALVLAYFLSAFVAVNVRGGIGVTMKMANFFLVYWLISHTAKDIRRMKKVLVTFFIGGLGVALAGLGTAIGTFDFNGAYLDGLISSTIQYHNAAAIYLFAIAMLGLTLTVLLRTREIRALVAGATYVILITALGAGSRGALLVVPIAMLVQFLGLPRVDKEKYFYTVLSVVIPLMLTAKSVLTFNENSQGFSWGIVLLGFMVSCMIQFGLERFSQLGGKVKSRYILSAGILTVVAVAALLFFKGGEIMPASVTDRVKEFNLQNNNVQDRFYFYRDALKIIKDHPILGVGGGGWNSIYRSYQSYWYDTSEVHNHFLQLWVESGTLGFTFYVLLWIGLIISSFRVLRHTDSSELKIITWTAFSAALAIGIHSAIDFTLSLGAIMLFQLSMMGLVRAGEEQTFGGKADYYFNFSYGPTIRKVGGGIIALVFFTVSLSFLMAVSESNGVIDAYRNGNLASAIAKEETATRLNPFDAQNLMNLSQLYYEEASSQGDATAISKGLNAAKEAVKYDSGDSETRWFLARAYFTSNQVKPGIQTAEEAIQLAPFVTSGYINLAAMYNDAAASYLKRGDRQTAVMFADKVLEIPARMKAQAAKLNQDGKKLFKGEPLDQVNPDLQKNLDYAGEIKAQ